ncbi:MAG: DUF5666 domain-containing protein [Minisyncoccota bacterium]
MPTIKRSLPAIIAGSALIGSFALAGTAFAATPGTMHARPVVVGTVAGISGDTLTVDSKRWKHDNASTTATTYTVDATNATVNKDGAASSLSAVAVGDHVMIKGTVSGTNVTATVLNDGKGGLWERRHDKKMGMMGASSTSTMTGNGEPIIGGNVTAVGTTTITVANKGAIIYTIDTASATVTKKGVSGATVSNIAVGDRVIVQGAVQGTSITASSIHDSGTLPSTNDASQSIAHSGGFMNSIGGFFSRMFGFF